LPSSPLLTVNADEPFLYAFWNSSNLRTTGERHVVHTQASRILSDSPLCSCRAATQIASYNTKSYQLTPPPCPCCSSARSACQEHTPSSHKFTHVGRGYVRIRLQTVSTCR